jgi:hypothetical protein
MKGDNHGEQGTKGKEQGKEKEEEREAKAAQEVNRLMLNHQVM